MFVYHGRMFVELVEDYMQWSATALDAAYREFELEDRRREATRLAMVQAIEARQVPAIDGHRSTRGYIKFTANTTGGRASSEVRRARLCRDFPEIGEALAAGYIGAAQVDLIARAFANPRLSDKRAAAVPVLLEHAEHMELIDFQRIVDRWVTLGDLDGSWREHLDDVAGRTAHVGMLGEGLDVVASGGDKITAEQYVAVFNRFLEAEVQHDMAARRAQYGEQAEAYPLPRTSAQRRYDALIAMAAAANAAADAGLAGKLPKIVVNLIFEGNTAGKFLERSGLVLPDGQILDVSELPDEHVDQLLSDLTIDPEALLTLRCETESGHVVHPVLLLRALLTEHIRRVVVESDGTRINFGRETRVFTGNARLAALLLEPRCEHVGCEAAGLSRQIDHNTEWNELGTTDQRNKNIECGPHNRFKHRAGWRSRRARTGRAYWIRPDGSLVLPAGERPPDLTDAEHAEIMRRRLAELMALPQTAA